jgi:hypothetical protein
MTEVCIRQVPSWQSRKKFQNTYKLDLVGVQEVILEAGGTEPAGEYIFFYGKGMKIMNWEQVLSYIENIAVYQQLRGYSLLVRACHTKH